MISKYIQKWFDIVENMRNDNTYKLAWGRSILEVIGEKEIVGDLTISFDELSPKIIKYYWNQIYFFELSQSGNKQPEIEQQVREMIIEYQGMVGDKMPVWYEKAEELFRKDSDRYYKRIKKVSTILSYDVCWRFMKIDGKEIPIYELDKKARTISFAFDDALELCDYRYMLSQIINYRWAQLLEQYNSAPRIARKVKGLSDNNVRRSNLTKFKNILLKYFDDKPIDFYTGEILKDNDISVDHVIPWSFMYSDDIWNLVLTSKTNNSKKSNNVPTIQQIEKLKERNNKLYEIVIEDKYKKELYEARINSYVDKFYNSLKY